MTINGAGIFMRFNETKKTKKKIRLLFDYSNIQFTNKIQREVGQAITEKQTHSNQRSHFRKKNLKKFACLSKSFRGLFDPSKLYISTLRNAVSLLSGKATLACPSQRCRLFSFYFFKHCLSGVLTVLVSNLSELGKIIFFN